MFKEKPINHKVDSSMVSSHGAGFVCKDIPPINCTFPTEEKRRGYARIPENLKKKRD